jgi:hypothetical protein
MIVHWLDVATVEPAGIAQRCGTGAGVHGFGHSASVRMMRLALLQ